MIPNPQLSTTGQKSKQITTLRMKSPCRVSYRAIPVPSTHNSFLTWSCNLYHLTNGQGPSQALQSEDVLEIYFLCSFDLVHPCIVLFIRTHATRA